MGGVAVSGTEVRMSEQRRAPAAGGGTSQAGPAAPAPDGWVNCLKCHALTRVDLQSLLDCEGVKYRRACVACSWDIWEVQPGRPVDVSRASLALALEAAVADPDPGAASTHDEEDEDSSDCL
jgi:hypothetical protein